MKSNLRLKSNVYLCKGKSLSEDKEFTRHVRGLNAIRKLLDIMDVPKRNQKYDDPLVKNLVHQGKLSISQLKALAWELPCYTCKIIPFGETFDGKIESRCEIPDCKTKKEFVGRSLNIPKKYLINVPLMDREKVLIWSIKHCKKVPPKINDQEQYVNIIPIVIKVDRTTDWLYSDEQLAAFLIYGSIKYQKG